MPQTKFNHMSPVSSCYEIMRLWWCWNEHSSSHTFDIKLNNNGEANDNAIQSNSWDDKIMINWTIDITNEKISKKKRAEKKWDRNTEFETTNQNDSDAERKGDSLLRKYNQFDSEIKEIDRCNVGGTKKSRAYWEWTNWLLQYSNINNTLKKTLFDLCMRAQIRNKHKTHKRFATNLCL